MATKETTMPRKGVDPGLARSLPGPLGSGAGNLPPPMPAGVLPAEDSRMWLFVPRAVRPAISARPRPA